MSFDEMRLQYRAKMPIKTVSEANSNEHWSAKHKRHKEHRKIVAIYFRNVEIVPPCTISLTRIAPRMLDDDNLVGSLKHVRDYIADCILPGYQMGRADSIVNDGEFALRWEYSQEKGAPKEYAVKVEVA